MSNRPTMLSAGTLESHNKSHSIPELGSSHDLDTHRSIAIADIKSNVCNILPATPFLARIYPDPDGSPIANSHKSNILAAESKKNYLDCAASGYSYTPRPDLRPTLPAFTYCTSKGAGRYFSPNDLCRYSRMLNRVSSPTRSTNSNGPMG
jgi:hypothetical protein